MIHRALLIDCLPYLGAILGSVAALRVLIWISDARPRWQHIGSLNRDERGAVQSLSFVLTLPVFILIMLFIVQLSQLTIGRVFVEYAIDEHLIL